MGIKRKKFSHKGDNGRVLIVGGNEEFHGAPIFSALGAEATGVDLVRLVVPKSQKTLARTWSLNFIVNTFSDEHLTTSDVPDIVRLAKKSDVLVIGMGLGDEKETIEAVKQIIRETSCKLVVDADGLKGISKMLKREVVVTPHVVEATELLHLKSKSKNQKEKLESLSFRKQVAKQISEKLGVTTVLKGVVDVVCSPEGRVRLNMTGNAGMTVGGTGDVLAGVIGGLVAQGLRGFEAGYLAVRREGEAGDRLKKKKGFRFTAEEVARDLVF